MATMYIKDINDKWHKIDVGRTPSVIIHVDYGGCTGDSLCIDMDKLWLADGNTLEVHRAQCTTTEIGKVRINDEEVE